MTRDDDIIRVSEIGQYAYCARAWWMARVLGVRPENVAELSAGRAGHLAHGRAVVRAHRLRRLALVLLGLAVVALAVGIWLALGS